MKRIIQIILTSLSCLVFSSVYAQSKTTNDDISVSRNISATQYCTDGQPVVTVTIIINKNATSGPAFLEEDFSTDLQASSIKNDRAKFHTDSGKLLFEWTNIPYDRVVTVSYQLEVVNKPPDEQTVSGHFLYKKRIYPISSSSFSLKVVNGGQKPKPTPKKDSASINNNPINSVPSTTSEGVIYRIQIAATDNKAKVPELLKQYGINDEPYLETAGTNVIRVMIGNYAKLSSAKSRIDELKNKGLMGAFVTPYYKGKRTNLQEAAMQAGH